MTLLTCSPHQPRRKWRRGEGAAVEGRDRACEVLVAGRERRGEQLAVAGEKPAQRVCWFLAIVTWRDAGCPPAEPLGTELIRELMDWIACEPVPDDYGALYLEEMDLAGQNPRALPVDASTRSRDDLSVLVIGCGESGLLAGIRLKEAGIPFEIIEKNGDIGGTWLENSYPGARVDVATHYYCYSFESNDEFSEYYARQPELYCYFRKVFDQHGLAEHVRWHSEVERAQWDETAGCWHVTIRGPQGTREIRSAQVLISAVGLLSRPLIPDLPNLDTFYRPGLPHRRLGPYGRPGREARRPDRGGGQRIPGRPRDRRRRRAAHRVPAHPAVDGAEPPLPRTGDAR